MARILVVEDDLITRQMLGIMVDALGHIPVFSPDGLHALETLAVDPDIQMVITDVVMPRMDGKQLIRTLRDSDRYRSLPIIVTSGIVGPKDIAELLRTGASRFQPKPIDIAVLEENIDSVLNGGEADGFSGHAGLRTDGINE
ncbi:MAG TPA: response regulator [Verrucomicrobia bacterium]|nr:response regulator [Verrucomicrobiota bacterium]